MFDRALKIKLIQYLESVTPGSTESHSLEKMTTRQLDDLIRLCRVNPDDENSMARAKAAMEQRYELRKELRREFLFKPLSVELNEMYDGLGPECKLAFIQFVEYNRDSISPHVADDPGLAWLTDSAQMPSVDFWSGGVGEVMNEILYRLAHEQTVDGALTSKFTHSDGTVRPMICCDKLVQVLDTDTKNDLFWRYARARLGR
jgi:hypothetical protein